MAPRALTQAEPKLEPWLDLLLVKSAIVDEQVPVGIIAGGDGRPIVARLLGNCVRQLSTGRCSPVDYVDQSISRLLAWVR